MNRATPWVSNWVKMALSLCGVAFLCSCQETAIPQINLVGPPLQSISTRARVPVQLQYQTGEEAFVLDATINRRGGWSYSMDKYSYTLRLPDKLPLCGLPTDNDWVLNASYIDKTFMRHKLAYDLFRQMGSNNLAPHCSYLSLQYNKEYQGLYILMEKMDASSLHLDKKQEQACIFKDPPLFIPDSLTVFPDSNNKFEQKYPPLQKQDKNRELQRLKQFLFYAEEADFNQYIPSYFDLKNIIDWHLLLLFTNNSDGILKNFYLYKTNNTSPYRIAIWDYDHSLGRDGDNELNLSRPLRPERSILLRRLMDHNTDNYRCQLAQRFGELRDAKVFSKANVQQMIQSNLAQIEKELLLNAQRWPNDGKWYYDGNDYRQELEIIDQYLDWRLAALDQYFQELAKACGDL